MPKLPLLSWYKVIGALSKLGYEMDHQTGSHIILRNSKPPYRRAVVPKREEILEEHCARLYGKQGLR